MSFFLLTPIKIDCNQLQQLQSSCDSIVAMMQFLSEFEFKCRAFSNCSLLQQLQSSCNCKWQTEKRIFKLAAVP